MAGCPDGKAKNAVKIFKTSGRDKFLPCLLRREIKAPRKREGRSFCSKAHDAFPQPKTTISAKKGAEKMENQTIAMFWKERLKKGW